jgi:hypothetical protein
MPAPSRPWLLGLTLGFLIAAGLAALVGPSLPALAQSGRSRLTVEPFRARGSLVVSTADDDAFELTPAVPAGKVLVVESVFGGLQIGGAGNRAFLQIGPAGEEVTLPTVQEFSSPAFSLYLASPTTTRLYFGAGPLRGKVVRFDVSVNLIADLTVVGHLVPAPAP